MCCLLITLLLGMYTAEKTFMWGYVYSCVRNNFICNSPKLGGRQGECSKSVEGINKLGQKSYTGTLHSTKMNKILL